MLNVCEIFTSLQGESTLTGYLCAFIRLSGCNLRCVWCDTRYSYGDNDAGTPTPMTVNGIIAQISQIPVDLVEITGGEPLLQPDTPVLCKELLRLGYKVMIETNGSRDISVIPREVYRIIDIKCPGSGQSGSFFIDNLKNLSSNDEIKFVLASIDDAVWAKEFCGVHELIHKCSITFSPVSATLPPDKLADWMVKNHISGIRLGLQLHKTIWGNLRGV
jgi:7-carboxy-7-deazaguanine synthase